MEETKSRREMSKSKNARLLALQKLKNVRSGLDKCDIKNEEDVYEEVDEEVYAEIVQKRQQDEWIVDDDGVSGYVEDGREVFDDCEDDDVDYGQSYNDYGKKEKRKKIVPLNRKKDKSEPKVSEKGGIKSLFINQQMSKGKKGFKDANLDDDNLLDDILHNIKSEDDDIKPKPIASSSMPVKLKKKESQSTAQSNSGKYKNIVVKQEKTGSFKRRMKEVDDFDSYLDRDFVKDLNTNIKKIKTEPIDDLDETELATVENEPLLEYVKLEDDWSSGIASNVDATSSSVATKSAQLEGDCFEQTENGTYLKFFWLDAYEDSVKNLGRVYLFGKVRSLEGDSRGYVSCCVIIENIERRVYLLPKATNYGRVSIEKVYNEFTETIAKDYGIKNFRTRKIKKYYSFELEDVPDEAEYLEVLYPANYKQLSSDLKGETFSHIFGTTQSCLERLILDLKLTGPSWLKIKNSTAVSTTTSWCKKEFSVDFSLKNIMVDKENTSIPPLTICCLNLKTHLNQIICIGCLVKYDYKIDGGVPSNPFDLKDCLCMVTKPSGHLINFPYDFSKQSKLLGKNKNLNLVKIFENEQFMLNQFLINLHRIDPDIIVGHDFIFDLDCILSRQSHFNDKINWSRLGRLRRTNFKVSKSQKDKSLITCGRLICDIKIMAKELIKAKSYELEELVGQVLKKERTNVTTSVQDAYQNSRNLNNYLNHLLTDNRFILSIMYELNAIPLAFEITKIAGNLFSKTLMGGRSERNEYLLLHAFFDKNFIVPNKLVKKATTFHAEVVGDDEVSGDAKSKRKAAYAGGLVLEPKVGFYENFILLMDFNSLYPSIIQEYNICFTTIKRNGVTKVEDGDEIPELPSPDASPGILPVEIRKLVESRREVKKLMCQNNISQELKNQYNIKQLALKLTANSMYGCLGFSNSRFYAKPLAALITYKGRDILMSTKTLVENMGIEVIYGDTDSIMINTNCAEYAEVMKLGHKVQSEVNKFYRLLEIEIDGVFKSMLLLKKKKYAALTVSKTNSGELIYKKEMKGIDIVRRDWSVLAKNTGELVVNEILSGKSNEEIVNSIHKYLQNLAANLRMGNFTDEMKREFEITKQLTRNPEDYPDKKHLTHVMVALRRNTNVQMDKKLRAGDVVSYVICTDTSNSDFNLLPATQRGFHPDELKENSNLQIDIKYYLSQQILPVVSRLCDPIEGTDNYILAEFLGIESNVGPSRAHQVELEEQLHSAKEDLKYDSCASCKLMCPKCGKEIEFRKIFLFDEAEKMKKINVSISVCSNCQFDFRDYNYYVRIEQEFNLFLRKFVSKFYEGWLICEDPLCNFRTRSCTGYLTRKGLTCPNCNDNNLLPEFSDTQLYHQFSFFEYLLDLEKAIKSLKEEEKSELFLNF